MSLWTVGDAQEAVELAQEMKAAGRYTWFRGQIKDWPPISTLGRMRQNGKISDFERARERFALFCGWLSDTPPLRHLLNEDPPHRFFAIAQHYGIPTHYIDFTTDPAVAGYFAAEPNPDVKDGMSCIYCLDVSDLMDLMDSLAKAGVRQQGLVERVETDVSNLWRLQAQRGVFLYAPYNWDIDYPMDRILFPRSDRALSYPPRDRVVSRLVV